jgi:hypothetical protein
MNAVILSARRSRLLAIGRTIPSPSSTSAGCFACKQDSGRAKALGIRRQCRTAPTGLCRARQRSFVKAAVVYTNWLAPGFKSDWQEHSSILVQTAPSNFLALASRVSVSATRCLPTIPIAVLQKPLICKKCSNSTLVRLFDMACYATSTLTRRI